MDEANAIFAIVRFVFSVIGIPISYVISKVVETRHLRSLIVREKKYSHIVTTNLNSLGLPGKQTDAHLIDAQAVIGSGNFKATMTSIRRFIGGRIKPVETLMMRGRREALVRLLEKADRAGATHILNIRFESSSIAKGKITAEIHAYGTAVTCLNTA